MSTIMCVCFKFRFAAGAAAGQALHLRVCYWANVEIWTSWTVSKNFLPVCTSHETQRWA